MPPKSSDRLAEIRARVARRAEVEQTPAVATNEVVPAAASEQEQPADQAALAAASAHFLGYTETLARTRSVERLALGAVAPDMHPDRRQARLLPLPEELLVAGEPAAEYSELVEELLALGQSLRERQIQPIIVYAGSSAEYPAARYTILVGHRRWTAAVLSGLEALDAIVIEPPDAVERVRIQYAENEEREEFSDMERAWALDQMKRTLADAPWEAVERQFGLSRTRRHELTRLFAFSAAQQRQLALLRMQETQVRSLHAAIRAGELSLPQVDQILQRLMAIASERRARLALGEGNGETAERTPGRRSGIDGPTVARLVERARRSAAPGERIVAPRWFPLLRDQIATTARSLQRAQERLGSLDGDNAALLLVDLQNLTARLTAITTSLAGGLLPDEQQLPLPQAAGGDEADAAEKSQ